MNEDVEPQDLEARAAELQARLEELEKTTESRVIRSELKAEAIRAGMVDLDGLKLVETDGLTLDAKGEVAGAAELMRELRRSKPWLFGGGSSSSTARAPAAQPPRPKRATEMSVEEWQAARAELVRRK